MADEVTNAELNQRLNLVEKAFQNEEGNGEEGPIVSVPNILTRLVTLEDKIKGPPAWEVRLNNLEIKQTDFEAFTAIAQAHISQEAGTPDDTAHRKSSRTQATEVVVESEHRTNLELLDLRQRLNNVVAAVNQITGVGIWMIVIASVTLAVIFNIGYQVIFA